MCWNFRHGRSEFYNQRVFNRFFGGVRRPDSRHGPVPLGTRGCRSQTARHLMVDLAGMHAFTCSFSVFQPEAQNCLDRSGPHTIARDASTSLVKSRLSLKVRAATAQPDGQVRGLCDRRYAWCTVATVNETSANEGQDPHNRHTKTRH